MALLFDEDYLALAERGLTYEEDPAQRFFVFTNYDLPSDIYTVERSDVLVIVPANYNQDGNDMFWTHPRLIRRDGQVILNTSDPGPNNDNRSYSGREFCRWSRHWLQDPGMWRPGKDDIISIHRRLEWAFHHPDTK